MIIINFNMELLTMSSATKVSVIPFDPHSRVVYLKKGKEGAITPFQGSVDNEREPSLLFTIARILIIESY